ESIADNLLSPAETLTRATAVALEAKDAWHEIRERPGWLRVPYQVAEAAARAACGAITAVLCVRAVVARDAANDAARAAKGLGDATWTPQAILEDLTPRQHAPVPPSILTWDGSTIANMAASIYDGNRFDRMPLLGDALEEAGYADGELLAHLR